MDTCSETWWTLFGMTLMALADRSKHPRHSPKRTDFAIEQAILTVRDEHPAWGARKLQVVLSG